MTEMSFLKSDLVKLLYFLKEARQIEGKTKFQKMVFLAQQEENLNIGFEFIKYNYGPYSFDMTRGLEALEEIGLIDVTEKSYVDVNDKDNELGKAFTFKLSDEGVRVIEQTQIDSHSKVIIKKIISEWNPKSRAEIIKYVYSKYMN